MANRCVDYMVVRVFESAHSAALWQVEMLNRGVTAHVWPNDDPDADPSSMWFVIVPAEQADFTEAARRASAEAGLADDSAPRLIVTRPPSVHRSNGRYNGASE